MEASPVLDAIATMRAAHDTLAALPIDQLTHPELLTALSEMEAMARQLPTQSHRIIARLHREATPRELGAKTLKQVLKTRLRISGTDATRRLTDAKDLGPRTSFTGEAMPPLRAAVAAAQAAGTIGPEHVAVIRGFFTTLPVWTDPETLECAEQTLVELAAGFCPEEVSKAADRLAALIDQDGPEPDDAERARKRCVRVARQGPDGMSKVTGCIDPQLLATYGPILAKLAAPGHVQPRRREPLHQRHTHSGTDRRR